MFGPDRVHLQAGVATTAGYAFAFWVHNDDDNVLLTFGFEQPLVDRAVQGARPEPRIRDRRQRDRRQHPDRELGVRARR